MLLHYGGGEIAKFRQVVADAGNLPISLSYFNLMRNDKKIPEYSGSMLLDSGAMSVSKSDALFEVVYEHAAEYMSFVKANIHLVNIASEFDAKQLTLPVIKQLRSEFYNSLPENQFMPVWHPDYGNEELEDLCSSYPLVGVTQEDIHGDTGNVSLFNSMIQRYEVKLHGVGITSKKLLEAVNWTSVSSTAWLSTTRYGELFVWTGKELKRYPKSYKDRAAKTHRNLFTDNGFDYEKIDNSDSDELLKLSVWSWQKYIDSLSGVSRVLTNQSAVSAEKSTAVAGNQEPQQRTEPLVYTPPTERATVPLPLLFNTVTSYQNDDGVFQHEPTLNIRSESLRICNTCQIRNNCPGSEENSTCLYNIPIEIKTKQQLKNLKNSLIEIQSQRVLFMKMAEDVSGGYADANLSSEIDRLSRMIKTSEDGDKDKFAMTVTMSQDSKGPSFMEKMFGSQAHEKVQELESPINADEIIKSSGLADD
jgi:hypothetical protein